MTDSNAGQELHRRLTASWANVGSDEGKIFAHYAHLRRLLDVTLAETHGAKLACKTALLHDSRRVSEMPCEWRVTDIASGEWTTACGQIHNLIGSPAGDGVTFCPRCGHRVEEIGVDEGC